MNHEMTDEDREWLGFPADGRAELQPEIDRLTARVAELEGWISQDGLSALIDERDRYREALETIANPPNEDATDPDDIAKEVHRLKAPALGCLKCFPGDDCPEGCLDRNYRVTDN